MLQVVFVQAEKPSEFKAPRQPAFEIRTNAFGFIIRN